MSTTRKTVIVIASIILVVIAGSTVATEIVHPGSFFSALANSDAMRTLITVFTLGAVILLSLSGVLYSMFGADVPNSPTVLKDRIDACRGFLSPFVGIFGTVLGFYFGSTPVTKTTTDAPLQFGVPILSANSVAPGGTIHIVDNVLAARLPTRTHSHLIHL